VTEPDFVTFLREHTAVMHGLSVTMPLKESALRFSDQIDAIANATQSVNTLSFSGGLIRGFNTDVFGIIAALEGFLKRTPTTVAILGNGATARSVLLALCSLAPEAGLTIYGRSIDKVAALAQSALAQPLKPQVAHLNAFDGRFDLTINTMPSGAANSLKLGIVNGQLFEVGYGQPSSFNAHWSSVDRIDGLEMLIWQALAQIRIFVTGSPSLVLDQELKVLKAMRKAVGR
jgi:shikimate dehydrogenase